MVSTVQRSQLPLVCKCVCEWVTADFCCKMLWLVKRLEKWYKNTFTIGLNIFCGIFKKFSRDSKHIIKQIYQIKHKNDFSQINF